MPVRMGLSPRVRGNRKTFSAYKAPLRSIPARAGEPWCPVFPAAGKTVYPRACGGTDRPAYPKSTFEGLSPRVRGNRAAISPDDVITGSIPARAGEPRRLTQ